MADGAVRESVIVIKKYLKYIGYALTAVSIVFLVIKMCGIDYSVISVDSVPSFVLYSFIGVCLGAASVFILGAVYAGTVKSLSMHDAPTGTVLVYVRSNIGKYIPGNVFQYVERNIKLKDSGLKQLEIAGCSVLEVGELLIAGAILSCGFAGENLQAVFEAVSGGMVILFIGVLACILVVALVVLNKKSQVVHGMLIRMKSRAFLRRALINIVIYMLVLLIMSSLMVLSVLSIADTTVVSGFFLRIIAAFVVSWIAGFVVIGAPGGIGIREAVIALFFADTPICDIILAASVLQRVISILGDICAFLIALFCQKNRIRNVNIR